jgi:hypothetical protein
MIPVGSVHPPVQRYISSRNSRSVSREAARWSRTDGGAGGIYPATLEDIEITLVASLPLGRAAA